MTARGGEGMSKYAVVVGLGRMYGENLGGDNDAKLMAQILKSGGSKVKVLTNRKATRSKVIDAIRLQPNVFFFSGHGSREFIQLWDGRLSSFQLKGLFEGVEFLCFQACYSGSLVDNLVAPNRIVISSATDDSPSVDMGRYSLWGYKFLDQGIKKGKADLNCDGRVSVQEAFEYTGLGIMSDNYGSEMFL